MFVCIDSIESVMNEVNNIEMELLSEIEQLRTKLNSIQKSKEEYSTQHFNSEERFAAAMRSANDGLWDWNLETNEVYYSPRWKSMLGYKECELEDNIDTWASLVHLDEKEFVLQEVQRYLAGESDSFEVEMRMRHKNGHEVFVRSRAFKIIREAINKPVRLIGTHVDITFQKKAELFNERHAKIIEMIAKGEPVTEIYIEIALLYEERHPGLRCSMLELEGNKLLHGGAPSLPKGYCDAVNGLVNGPDVGSCGTSTFTGERVLVENIETDPKWKNLKDVALPHGMRCCWSEPIKNSNGQVLGAFGMYYDYPALPNNDQLNDLISASRLAGIVMERERNQKSIRELAFTDILTGLSSRSHFYLNMEELIKSSSRNNRKFGVLYIDLDNFKHINDSLGHDAGDMLLKEVACRLTSACREIDYISRLSGDEFCLIVSEIKENYETAQVAQRCLELISTSIELVGRQFTPACSIGIAHYPENGKDLQSLLKAADTALYSAKELGKNRYAFYCDELTHKAEHRFKVEQYLREAIENQQLSVVYQPKIDIKTGKIESVEALTRWEHAKLGEVSPSEFIVIAEQIGMIIPLTEWVLKTACEQVRLWSNEGFSDVRMAINISPSHFLDNEFIPLIEQIIHDTGISPDKLELEVTEGVVQTDKKNLDVFKHLKQLGLSLAIDDFGTGYSSFASLKHINVDYLKIDKYFIDEMLTDNKSLVLIQSMIEMGHNLDYQVTAEGIESREQYQILKQLGCDSVQGFLFSKPVSAEEILTLQSKH